jgi:hypothetical protein
MTDSVDTALNSGPQDNCSQTPFLYGESTVVSYDDPQSIALKATLARCKGLAGLTFFAASGDTADHILLNAAVKAFTATDACPAFDGSMGTTSSVGSSSAAVPASTMSSANPAGSMLAPPSSGGNAVRPLRTLFLFIFAMTLYHA